MTESILRPIAQCGKCLASVEPSDTSCDSCGSFFADARMIQFAGLPHNSSVKLTKTGELKMNATQIQSGTGLNSSYETALLGCQPGKLRVCRSIRVKYPLDVITWDMNLFIDGLYQVGVPMKMFTVDDSACYGAMSDISLAFHSIEKKHQESVGTILLENVILTHGNKIYLTGNDATTRNNYASASSTPMELVVEFIEHDRN